MFRSTHPTGCLQPAPRNSETLESTLIRMYRDQAEVLRERVDQLEQQLANVLSTREENGFMLRRAARW